MKNLSRLTFISLCILFVTSCGGGGGGSGGSGSGQTSASYQYDPIASTYANKAWDSITMAKLNRVDGYYADYAFNVQSTLVENSSVGYDVTLDGQGIYTEEVISYDWSITEENTSVVDLYDSSGFVKAQSGTQNFSNAEVKIISGDVTWLANNLIQYTNLSFTEIDVYGGRKDTFPLVYGDKTSIGDLAGTGTLSFDVTPWVVLDIYQSGSNLPTKMVAEGEGTVSVNLSSNQVTGTVTLSRYFDYWMFMSGGTDYSELFNMPEIEITLSGSLQGVDLSGDIEIAMQFSEGLLASFGQFKGALFGPDGGEIGVTFAMWKNDENEIFAFHDTVGAFIGQ